MQARFCSSTRLEMAKEMLTALIFKISKNVRFHVFLIFLIPFCSIKLLQQFSRFGNVFTETGNKVHLCSVQLKENVAIRGKFLFVFRIYTIAFIKDEKSVKNWL